MRDRDNVNNAKYSVEPLWLWLLWLTLRCLSHICLITSRCAASHHEHQFAYGALSSTLTSQHGGQSGQRKCLEHVQGTFSLSPLFALLLLSLTPLSAIPLHADSSQKKCRRQIQVISSLRTPCCLVSAGKVTSRCQSSRLHIWPLCLSQCLFSTALLSLTSLDFSMLMLDLTFVHIPS